MTTTTSIPIIDIAPYLDGSDKQGVADQIDAACRSIGFFMVAGHGLSPQALVPVAQEFFAQDVSTKSSCKEPFGLGYMGQGTENVGATLDATSTAVDTKESINLTLPVRETIWPASKDFRSVCEEYYTKVQELANHLLRLFALALKLDEHYFDDKVDQAYTTLRLLNYPKTENASAATRNAPHTDYGTLTILWSPDSRGLQAQSREGVWIDVIANPAHFIVNIGDLMANWTNDAWVSTLHQVVPHDATKQRFSVPFFHNPNPDALIECIATCCSPENPAKYAPILAKEHLEHKVSKALGQTEKMAS